MMRTNRSFTLGGASGTTRAPSESGKRAPRPPPATPENKGVAAAAALAGLPSGLPSWMIKECTHQKAASGGSRENPFMLSSPFVSPPRMNAHQTSASEAGGEAPSIISSISASSPAKTPYAYQSDIADKCERENCLIVLPTGAGKTIIAAEVIKRLPQGALFLVPTRELVIQQARALRSWTGLHVGQLRGREEVPQEFEVLVATPDAFVAAQTTQAPHLQWSSFKVVVFDEVHHVRGNHPYRKLAESLRKSCPSPPPRVLGLTASYTYDSAIPRAEIYLCDLCKVLGITKTVTANSKELEDGGVHAAGAVVEVSLPPVTVTPTGVLPKAKRTEQQAATFFRREEMQQGTGFARRLMACVRSMEKAIVEASEHAHFASPLVLTGTEKPKKWGAYAKDLANDGDARRVSSTRGSRRVRRGGSARGGGCTTRSPQSPSQPSSRPMLAELEHWYEAVRTLVVSWEEREDDAAIILDMGASTGSPSYHQLDQRQQRDVWPGYVLEHICVFWKTVPDKFPRYEHFKNVLLDKYRYHGGDGGSNGGGGKAFHGIVFVCRRLSTHVLAHVIQTDPRLSPLFLTACVHASGSAASAFHNIPEAQAQAAIASFREKHVNLLLATAVVEEGMDVPSANCVLCYDAPQNIVAMVQRRGRAREEGSSFVILDERDDRTTADLLIAEQKLLQRLEYYEPPQSNIIAAGAAGLHLVQLDDVASTDAGSADTSAELDEGVAVSAESLLVSNNGNSTEVEVSQREMGVDAVAGTGDALLAAQRRLERGAIGALLEVQKRHGLEVGMSSNGTPVPPPGVLSAATEYSGKTNAVLTESFKQDPASRLWVCTLLYKSALRELYASGEAVSGKKTARKLAAARLVADLIVVLQ